MTSDQRIILMSYGLRLRKFLSQLSEVADRFSLSTDDVYSLLMATLDGELVERGYPSLVEWLATVGNPPSPDVLLPLLEVIFSE